MSGKVEIRPHIAQAVNRLTGEKLRDANGKPVPLFPDERSVWVDGRMVGYVGPGPKRNLCLIYPETYLGPTLVNWVKAAVLQEFGNLPDKVSAVPDTSSEDAPEEYDAD